MATPSHPLQRHIGATYRTTRKCPSKHPVRTIANVDLRALPGNFQSTAFHVEYTTPEGERTAITAGAFVQWLRGAKRISG